MARGRNIKPSFFTNEDLAEVEPLARILFIGMWTISNFKGCFEYRPKRLKVQLLPYDECDIETLVNNLEHSGFISTYSVQGQRYVKIINFTKHQNPHKNERDGGTDIPDIDERDDTQDKKSLNVNGLNDYHDLNGTNHDLNGIARADSLNLIPDFLNLIPENINSEIFISDSDKPKRFDFKKQLLNFGGDVDLVDAFMQVRKTKKSTNSEKALQLFMKSVESSNMNLNQVLEICVQRDWKGFDISWLKSQNGFNQSQPQQQNGFIDFSNIGQKPKDLSQGDCFEHNDDDSF